MAFEAFDVLIDRITERELVYDIIERLKLGKQMTSSSGTRYHDANEMLVDVIKKLISLAPPDVVDNYKDIRIGNMHIPAGDKTGVCTIPDLAHGRVLLAYSQQTQMDIKEALTITSGLGTITCTFNAKVPLLKDEVIKIYAY